MTRNIEIDATHLAFGVQDQLLVVLDPESRSLHRGGRWPNWWASIANSRCATETHLSKETPDAVTTLLARLDKLGLDRAYVESHLLPSWWDHEVGSTPAGLAEMAMILSRRASLQLKAVLAPAGELEQASDDAVRFKVTAGKAQTKLRLAQSLVVPVARMVARSVKVPFSTPGVADELRSKILESGAPWVGFGVLLRYCWTVLGIPVLPISTFPAGSLKMDGLATNIAGRPVIIISKAAKQPGWLLFILAHELGHIASGHLAENETLVDGDLTEAMDRDQEERQANEYALSLLRGGSPKLLPRRKLTNENLAQRAEDLGREERIHPSHLILSYARDMKFWAAAGALDVLYPGADGVSLMQKSLEENLDWSEMSPDAAEHVRRMTGLPSE